MLYDDFHPASAGAVFFHDDLPFNTFFQFRHMRDYPYQTISRRKISQRPERLLKRFLVQRAEPFIHKHGVQLYAPGAGLDLIGQSQRQRQRRLKDSPPERVFTLRSEPL